MNASGRFWRAGDSNRMAWRIGLLSTVQGNPLAVLGSGVVGAPISFLDLVRHLVGAAVLRSAQRADAAGDGAVHVGAGAGNDAAGEGAGVELVLGVEDERSVHRPYPGILGFPAVQQMKVVAADRVVVGLRAYSFS